MSEIAFGPGAFVEIKYLCIGMIDRLGAFRNKS